MITCLILGSGGAVPTATRTPAAYWLDCDGPTLLMDPGPGALNRLFAASDGPDSLDELNTVLFSHFHPDHCADLTALLFALKTPVATSTSPLQLIGPVGLGDYLLRLRELYGDWLTPRRRAVVTTEVAPGDVLIPAEDPDRHWLTAPATSPGHGIEVFAAAHSEDRFSRDNLLFRFRDTEDHTLVYTGDSQPCAELTAAARGVDLLLTECSIPDQLPAEGHMTPAGVGDLCRDARPGRVVLTHLYPACDALDLESLVAERFDGPVVRAADGMLLRVPSGD